MVVLYNYFGQKMHDDEINLLRQNARSVVRELGLLNDAYFDIGVTLAERHLLIELASCNSPITAGEIAERLLLEKSTVSRLIAKAVKKGYVLCSSDKKDKRRRLLYLTKVGEQTLNAFEPIAFNQTKQALENLNQSEVELVYQGIALYAKGLKNSRLQIKEEAPLQTSPIDIIVRPFEKEDEAALYEIFQEVVDSGIQFPYESSSKEEFKHQFFSPDSQVFVCLSPTNELIGGFYLKGNYSGRSDHIANAAYMLKKSARGKGIGTQLVKASLQLAKERGFAAMQYNMVLSQNQIAVKLYHKLGFKIVGTIPNAVRNPDGSYQDGFVMYKKI